MKLYKYISSTTKTGMEYIYILTHGIGPGTLPKDVNIIKTKDIGDYTVVWLDGFLSNKELEQYDIPSETELKNRLNSLGYQIVDNDVVPINSDIDSCSELSDVTGADEQQLFTIKSISDDGTFYLVRDWRTNRNLWVTEDQMAHNPSYWFKSRQGAINALKSLLSIMDEYLTDKFYIVDQLGILETPISVADLGFELDTEY